ncbi:hypothetical protein J4448_05585 [Candidatus Woesearchaeota archaeon]|nr:hypothetical protein [Candidatus Woesearchaeota archaeon]
MQKSILRQPVLGTIQNGGIDRVHNNLYEMLQGVNYRINKEYLSLLPYPNQILDTKGIAEIKSTIDGVLRDFSNDRSPSVEGLRQYSTILDLLSQIPTQELRDVNDIAQRLTDFTSNYNIHFPNIKNGRFIGMAGAKEYLLSGILKLESKLKNGEANPDSLKKIIELGYAYLSLINPEYKKFLTHPPPAQNLVVK